MLDEARSLPLESAPRPDLTHSLREKKKNALYLLLVVILTAIPFLGTLRFGFVYDDEVQIVANESLRSWDYLPSYFTAHTWNFLYSGVGNYYRPLFLLWLRCNFALFHLNPVGWHLASVFLHMAVTALLYLVLRRHGFSPWTTAVGALFFGVSSSHVESVAWISGITDVLVLFFLLAGLLLWMKYTESRKLFFLILASFCFLLALLGKETAIVFPVVLLYYVWQAASSGVLPFDGKKWKFWAAHFAPFLLVAIFYFSLRLLALRSVSPKIEHIPFKTVLFTTPSLIWFYVRHAICPFRLSLFYDMPLVSAPTLLQFWLPLLFLLAAVPVLVWLSVVQKIRAALPATIWFVLPLVPVLALPFLPKNDFAHDRYLYISGVGAAIFISAFLEKYFGRERPPAWARGTVALLLLVFGIATAVQAEPWRDNLHLYLNATRIAPNHPTALNNLATALVERQQFEEARKILAPLVKNNPDYWLATYNLGYVSYKLGDLPAAETFLRKASLIDPNDSDQYLYLGLTLYKQGRFPGAETFVREAISRRSTPRGYHFALAMILLAEQKVAEACESFREELRQHPDQQAASSQLAACENKLKFLPPTAVNR